MTTSKLVALGLSHRLHQRAQQQAPQHHQGEQSGGRRHERQQQLWREEIFALVCAHHRDGDQDRRDSQILEQQHRENASSGSCVLSLSFGKQWHDDGRR
jgi:hypothetical protein